ncbi:MAG: DUF1080 domain-containing protein [Pirellulales bacterium]|nr:DUF1080 domain-containing protein [Pirellulales bacterium]
MIIVRLLGASRSGFLGQKFVLTLAACTLALATGVAPAAEETDREEGFAPLLVNAPAHWRGYAAEKWPESWEVVDGVLRRKGPGGDIMTKEKYADFDLRFDWKVAPGGNSGIMYRVSTGDDAPYYSGPEYQILDNAGHADGKSQLTSTGSLYALYPPTKDVSKPAGEWNSARIVIRKNRVQHYLNGELVVEAELGSDDWIKRVAKSKFASWEKFGKNSEGRLAFQDHGDEVWFRNIRVKRLTDDASDSATK